MTTILAPFCDNCLASISVLSADHFNLQPSITKIAPAFDEPVKLPGEISERRRSARVFAYFVMDKESRRILPIGPLSALRCSVKNSGHMASCATVCAASTEQLKHQQQT